MKIRKIYIIHDKTKEKLPERGYPETREGLNQLCDDILKRIKDDEIKVIAQEWFPHRVDETRIGLREIVLDKRINLLNTILSGAGTVYSIEEIKLSIAVEVVEKTDTPKEKLMETMERDKKVYEARLKEVVHERQVTPSRKKQQQIADKYYSQDREKIMEAIRSLKEKDE